MKALLLVIPLVSALPLLGQDTPPQQVPRRIVRPIELQSPSNSEGLKQNITIHLEGTTTTDAKVDLSLTGAGPRYTANQVIADEGLLKCEYLVSQVDAGYNVSYQISVQVKVKVASQANPNSSNFEYRDSSITGEAICAAGQPLVILKNGEKALQLTIVESKQ